MGKIQITAFEIHHKIIILAVILCMLLCSVRALAADRAEEDVIKVSDPVIEGTSLTYSVEMNSDDIRLISALYADGVLSDVDVDKQSGEFKLEQGKTYMLKVFAWEKGMMKPLSDSVSFDNLKASEADSKKLPSEEIEEIPAAYYSAAQNQGTLEELYYDTYDSNTYERKITPLRKRAIIYLPYGYDGDKEYNIFYLMHGGWSNETTTLGIPSRPSSFKNVIDNAIAGGEIKPLIIICPTYNNTNENGQDSDNFSLAMQLNRQFHNELLNDLIPAVESKYSTYAADTTPAGIAASRDHRGFGGFSMGSVATWRTFEHCLDYFRYFLPMSCGTSLDDNNIFSAARGHNKDEYFVWVMTGTNDFAYSYDTSRVGRMRTSPYFTENENFIYRVKDGYSHDGRASNEYTYNGLKYFWNE